MNYLAGAVCAGSPDRAESIGHILRVAAARHHAWNIDASARYSLATATDSDSSRKQKQPLPGARRALRVAGVVRVDNRAELLGHLGWPADGGAGQPDTSLFAAAWLRWGEDALSRIVGAFAVAVWDEDHHSLTLVRDHAGEYPVHFFQQGELLAFSSLPMPLRAIGRADTSLDEKQMMRYLAILSNSPTQTLFKNIQKLPPGHLLRFQNEVSQIVRYWHPMDASPTRYRTNDEYVEAFLEVFDRAVLARASGAGKIASELSGGLDSGSVTSTAARLLAPQDLIAYTAVPQKDYADTAPDGRFGNEGPSAARLAAMYSNIEHVLVDASTGELIAGLESSEIQGYPVFNPLNQIWMNAILDDCKRRGVQVLLNGTCGNATLSSSGLIGLSELFSKGHWLQMAALIVRLRQQGYTGLRIAASMALGPALPSWLQRKLAPDASRFSFAFSPLRPELTAQHSLRQQSLEEMYGPYVKRRRLPAQDLRLFRPRSVQRSHQFGMGR